MADFESMRKRHREDSVLSLSFFVFIIFIFIQDKYYSFLFKYIYMHHEDVKTIFEKSWLIVVIPIITYFISLFSIAKRDFYYSIDNYLFKKRKEIDKFICLELLTFQCKDMTNDDKEKINKAKELINDEKYNSFLLKDLFYRYIEKERYVNPTLKDQAFVYWGDYFSHITFILWGLVAVIVEMTIEIFYGRSILRSILFILTGIITISNFYPIQFGKLNKKLRNIPKMQIGQIHRNAGSIFLSELRKINFGLTSDE